MSARRNDIGVGLRFGRLVITGSVPWQETPDKRGYWIADCDCGNSGVRIRHNTHLATGRLKSCGCAVEHNTPQPPPPTKVPRMDLTGIRFGILTAVQVDETVTGQTAQGLRWWCKCDCGGAVTARTKDLRNGNTASCGCMRATSATARKQLVDLNRPWRKEDHVDDGWLVLVGERSPRREAP